MKVGEIPTFAGLHMPAPLFVCVCVCTASACPRSVCAASRWTYAAATCSSPLYEGLACTGTSRRNEGCDREGGHSVFAVRPRGQRRVNGGALLQLLAGAARGFIERQLSNNVVNMFRSWDDDSIRTLEASRQWISPTSSLLPPSLLPKKKRKTVEKNEA